MELTASVRRASREWRVAVRGISTVGSGVGVGPGSGLEGYFKFAERKTTLGTEARAGLTTFLVMAYIIFLNASILGAGLKLDPIAVAAATALIAGVMTIAMGIWGRYPFAIAAGLGFVFLLWAILVGAGLLAGFALGASLAQGCSGVRPQTLRALQALLRELDGERGLGTDDRRRCKRTAPTLWGGQCSASAPPCFRSSA